MFSSTVLKISINKKMFNYLGWFLCKLRKVVFYIFCAVLFGITLIFVIDDYYSKSTEYYYYADLINEFYLPRKNWVTSNLGALMFKDVLHMDLKIEERTVHTYIILIWKHKLLMHLQGKPGLDYSKIDPFNECSVHNCLLSSDENYVSTADAVVINLNLGTIPETKKRQPFQKWIFWTDENPYSGHPDWPQQLAGVFNWSMSYRTTSDIPVPFGQTIPLLGPVLSNDDVTKEKLVTLIPFWKIKRSDVLVSIFLDNCENKRIIQFVQELEKYVGVDVYGACVVDKVQNKNISCDRNKNCTHLSPYLFHLVIEDGSCQDYLTEKTFYNAYTMGAIPIMMGTTESNCKRLLPPRSYIHLHLLSSARRLARKVIEIAGTVENLIIYHKWRNYFEVVNEHGYYNTKLQHYCRICEALNFNHLSEKVYDLKGLRSFLAPELNCEFD